MIIDRISMSSLATIRAPNSNRRAVLRIYKSCKNVNQKVHNAEKGIAQVRFVRRFVLPEILLFS